MKRIITISREFGAGGGEIGRRVADELKYELYNRKLIFEAAREANVDVESLLEWDEKVPTNFGFAQSLFDYYNKPLSEKLFNAQRNVIKDLGEKGHCVIVGRNANSILKEYDQSLHVFIHADENWRLNRLKGLLPDTKESKIKEQIRIIDKKRKKYSFYHTKTEFGIADYYDISLRTSRLGIDDCVKLICELARSED